MKTDQTCQTNHEKIANFMDRHPLNQSFVLEALHRYAAQVEQQRERVIEGMKNNFVPGEAWVECACDWNRNNN